MTNITPRASMSPLGRQPFRPGQWQGYKGVSRNTTYIQNNFFGSGYNSGMNYGNYNNYCNNCDNGGSNKFMNWMMGIGVGTTLLGSILKMFGVGGKEENGAIEPEPKAEVKQQPKAEDKDNDRVVKENKAETPAAATSAVKPEPAKVEEPKEEKINWNDITNMVCKDDSGKTSSIAGKVTLGDNGEPPKSFTITDSTSGNVYKYELQETKDGEKPVYKCVSKNGQPATSENAYTLEKGADGKPELVQHENQGNYGQGLTFKSVLCGGNGGGNGQFTKTITVNTSVGQATITVTANSQKELDAKVAEREAESAKWAPQTKNTPAGTGTTPQDKPAETPANSNPWASLADGTAVGTTPWAKYAGNTSSTSSTTGAPKDQPSQATQQLNKNLQSETLSGDRKKAASEALNRVNSSKLPENKKEELRQKLADVTMGLQPQNKFNKVITEVNTAAQA